MRSFTIAGLAALVLAVACESTGPTSPTAEPAVATPRGFWALSVFDLDGGQDLAVLDPLQYTLDLGDDGRVSLRADCNLCNGSYRIDGSRFEVGLLACTLAACPPESLDRAYLAAIDSAVSFALDENGLAIAYTDGVLRFTER
jgi:heat shock protein HslJ